MCNKNKNKLNKKILIHAHIFYKEYSREIFACIRNFLGKNFDLYVTMVNKDEQLENEIYSIKSDAKILISENKGYDIGPFFEVLNKVNLLDYDYVVKLHTKNNFHTHWRINGYEVKGPNWRRYLLSPFSSKANVNKCLDILDHNVQIGMIGDRRVIVKITEDFSSEYKQKMLCLTKKFLQNKKIKVNPKNEFSFVAGSMFIIRSNILLSLTPFYLYEFTNSKRRLDNKDETDLAHIMEYAFGWLTTSKQYKNNLTYIIVGFANNKLLNFISKLKNFISLNSKFTI